ncbi:hypothetical protein DID88_009558 [Monilinia fructigena]|uniref:Uncharacterized protein n=1 Tax=Monilinia fructigena TaxID=38457 RepID=A0A395IT51_9HELO|nr:hypothetical protein DID88_009558 [Monilinia fructigena]
MGDGLSRNDLGGIAWLKPAYSSSCTLLPYLCDSLKLATNLLSHPTSPTIPQSTMSSTAAPITRTTSHPANLSHHPPPNSKISPKSVSKTPPTPPPPHPPQPSDPKPGKRPHLPSPPPTSA